jgi:hypothetical protein
MRPLDAPTDTPVVQLRSLRRAIGFIAVLLPWALVIGERLRHALFGAQVGPAGPWIERSISAYFHTGVRELFVGGLAAVGLFLLAYKGPQRRDEIASNVAGFWALVAATFPTRERPLDPADANSVTFFSDAVHADPAAVGGIHFVAAALLFVTLGYMSLFLFTRSDQPVPTRQKRKRNVVYRASGYAIFVAIAAIAVVKLAKLEDRAPGVVFWLESIAVVSFGVAWLTKSEIVLAD